MVDDAGGIEDMGRKGQMLTTAPQAYRLAYSLRPNLLKRFSELEEQLSKQDALDRLFAFEYLVEHGSAAINMSLPCCVDFLRSGEYLNIYELVAKETGKSKRALEEEVRRRTSPWYDQRRKIDGLFKFRRDTHYASLNLGGPGPERYGVCCVIFDIKHWAPYHTCYGGDSIRACFSSNGMQVVEDMEVLQKFGIGEDAYRIAGVVHRQYLQAGLPGFDQSELRGILEASDSLLEFHLHGSVRREHAIRVIMSRHNRNHYWELSLRASSLPKPWPQEYDMVGFFLEMVSLLDKSQIPFVLAENG
jgi:hypothetical protein